MREHGEPLAFVHAMQVVQQKFLPGEILSHQLERPIDNLIRNQELNEQSATEEELDGL